MTVNLDRTTFKSLLAISVVLILIIIIGVVSIWNVAGRFYRLRQAEQYVNGAGELEQNYQNLMTRFFELKKIKNGLAIDSTTSSYNNRIKSVVDKLKLMNLDMVSVEYGKEVFSKDTKYLPVTFELSGDYEQILQFVEFIENEVVVMGFGKLEISAGGASDTRLELNCIINFYELLS